MISTNYYWVQAQAGINNNLLAMDKSIGRLSTGRRVNSAADDAVALMASHRLTSNAAAYTALSDRAQVMSSAMNTASSGADSIVGLLQQMRSLAASASGASAQERANIQTEIEDLRSQITAAANAASFLNKSMLNGGYGAAWGAAAGYNDSVAALVRGGAATGAYKIDYNLTAGHNAIYGTNALTEKSLSAVTTYTYRPFSWQGYPTPARQDAETAWNGAKVEFTTGLTNRVQSLNAQLVDSQTTPNSTLIPIGTLGGYGGHMNFGGTVVPGGYIEVTFNNDRALGDAAGTTDLQWDWLDATTGTRYTHNFVSSTPGIAYLGDTNISNFLHMDINLGTNAQWSAGDKYLLYVDGSFGASDEVLVIDTPTTTNPNGTNYAYTYVSSGVWADTAYLAQMRVRLTAGNTAATGGSAWLVTLDAAGFHENKITWTPAMTLNNIYDATPVTATTTTIGSIAGEEITATSNTKLMNVSQLKDILGASSFLTIAGNNRYTNIAVDGEDTIADFVEKLRKAIADDLEMGKVPPNQLSRYLSAGGTLNGVYFGAGTIMLAGAATGINSEISIGGDSALLEAIGLKKMRDSEQDLLTATVFDVNNNRVLGTTKSYDGVIRGLVKDADFAVDIAGWTKAVVNGGKMSFVSTMGDKTAYINLANKTSRTGTGLEPYVKTNISFGSLTAQTLELDKINVRTEAGARIAAAQVDEALVRAGVAKGQSNSGMGIFNTAKGLTEVNRNILLSAISNLVDVDIAEEQAKLTKTQMLLENATSILMQANGISSYAVMMLM
ncbi:flagellin [Deferribacterales bacterium]|nr:flagellin [Deferribacterales bacterium]